MIVYIVHYTDNSTIYNHARMDSIFLDKARAEEYVRVHNDDGRLYTKATAWKYHMEEHEVIE